MEIFFVVYLCQRHLSRRSDTRGQLAAFNRQHDNRLDTPALRSRHFGGLDLFTQACVNSLVSVD
jgi:hypothetical protein